MSNFLTDNPAVYEARFPDPDHAAARFVADLLAEHTGPGPQRILDLGSGTGRDAGALASWGHQVTGIDSSAAMVEHARRHHPACEFSVGDMRTVDLGHRFDAVTCMDSALLYCHTNDDLRSCLGRVAAHLRPGGLFVAEMRNGAHYLGNADGLGVPVRDTVTHAGVTHTSVTTLHIDHGRQLLRRRRVWTTPGDHPLVQHSAWRLLFPQELRAWLEHAGLAVLAVFDGPGPSTAEGWPYGVPARLGESLSGRRLHVVARLVDPPTQQPEEGTTP